MVFTNLRVITAGILALGALGAGGLLPGDLPQAGKKTADIGQTIAVPVIREPLSGQQDPADRKTPTKQGLAEKERRHQALLKKLNAPANMDHGLEKMTLDEARKYFENRLAVNILTNYKSFKLADVGQGQVGEAEVKLDQMTDVPLRDVLTMLLDQAGASYLVRSGFIEITAADYARPESWPTRDRSFVPTVHAEFKDVPLDDALRELMLDSGISVVLDRRAVEVQNVVALERGLLEPTEMPHVTASFDGLCLDTAVEILATMCGLQTVALDRAIYVTKLEMVEFLEEQQAKRRARGPKVQEAK